MRAVHHVWLACACDAAWPSRSRPKRKQEPKNLAMHRQRPAAQRILLLSPPFFPPTLRAHLGRGVLGVYLYRGRCSAGVGRRVCFLWLCKKKNLPPCPSLPPNLSLCHQGVPNELAQKANPYLKKSEAQSRRSSSPILGLCAFTLKIGYRWTFYS
jgi:hypothetical protein